MVAISECSNKIPTNGSMSYIHWWFSLLIVKVESLVHRGRVTEIPYSVKFLRGEILMDLMLS